MIGGTHVKQEPILGVGAMSIEDSYVKIIVIKWRVKYSSLIGLEHAPERRKRGEINRKGEKNFACTNRFKSMRNESTDH